MGYCSSGLEPLSPLREEPAVTRLPRPGRLSSLEAQRSWPSLHWSPQGNTWARSAVTQRAAVAEPGQRVRRSKAGKSWVARIHPALLGRSTLTRTYGRRGAGPE